MSMVMRHNAAALHAAGVLENSSKAFSRAVQKLSSGLRVNAWDLEDAAGLGISERMRAQVRGFDRAVSNEQDVVSMIQTAEGSLKETDALLQRMRELTVQASSDVLTQQDRGYVQAEIDQIREEITRIGNTAQFNGKKLLNGDAAAIWSSSDSDTIAVIHGGLLQTDQFGQRHSIDANYKISLTANAGQGEVRKSVIFSARHELEDAITGEKKEVTETAAGSDRLRDVEQFYDAEGRFMLDDPKTISITQGDGQRTSVTLYGDDTLDTVAAKFNDAIANDLGQARFVNDAGHLASFVTEPGGGQESVAGTMLVRSVMAGSAGQLTFSGDENVLNAFGFNSIQTARENRYSASIADAHTGAPVSEQVKLTGSRLIGAVNQNVDVEFSEMAGVTVSWDSTRGTYIFESGDYETTLHLKDNTSVFQTGIGEGETITMNIGDMRSHALGLDSVRVSDRKYAARSISIVDKAIDTVAFQRAKLGASLNRVEHSICNLTTAGENITADESRIRDADMAQEMMNFAKVQILLRSGTSMMAQANQIPEQIMSLMN